MPLVLLLLNRYDLLILNRKPFLCNLTKFRVYKAFVRTVINLGPV